MRPAVFIDKDGTLVHDVPFNVDPARVRLRDDAGPALSLLQRRGYRLVLVTNQSGVAHGHFDEAALEGVWRAISEPLAGHGVSFSAFMHCPHHPEGRVTPFAVACDCRKPAPGMLLRAAREHGLDLRRSWLIGDILDDIEAGRRASCRTILLDVGSETEWRRSPLRHPQHLAASLTEAAGIIISEETDWRGESVPPAWGSETWEN